MKSIGRGTALNIKLADGACILSGTTGIGMNTCLVIMRGRMNTASTKNIGKGMVMGMVTAMGMTGIERKDAAERVDESASAAPCGDEQSSRGLFYPACSHRVHR